jgi:hypothetical protein
LYAAAANASFWPIPAYRTAAKLFSAANQPKKQRTAKTDPIPPLGAMATSI